MMGRMVALVALTCALFGLLFGSFGNVVIHRVPQGESIVRPPSSCPGCGTQISPRDNIPVVSWLLLRGRCRHCGQPISVRYPVVELAGAILFGVVGAWIAGMAEPDWWALPAYLLFAWMLLVVSVIDLQTKRIPNALTYPLTPALLVLLAIAALANSDPAALLRAVLAALGAFVFLLVLALVNPRGMGMGDVKLGGFLGLGLGYIGWGAVIVGLFGAFLLGAVVSIVLIATKLRGRKDLIPFGPYLAVGAFLAVFSGERIADAYLGTIGA